MHFGACPCRFIMHRAVRMALKRRALASLKRLLNHQKNNHKYTYIYIRTALRATATVTTRILLENGQPTVGKRCISFSRTHASCLHYSKFGNRRV